MEQNEGREEAERNESLEQSESNPTEATERSVTTTAPPGAAGTTASPWTTTYPYFYAIGRVEPRFPSLAVEKEFTQATGRLEETAGLTNREVTREMRANLYQVRQLCCVLTIEGLETYILQPRDPADFDQLVEAVRSTPRPIQVADNAGATDEHRALNFLAMRYPAIYARAAESHAQNLSFSGVEVRPSRLSGTLRIVDVISSFTYRQTDGSEKCFFRVDVTEEWPFLITRLSPFFER